VILLGSFKCHLCAQNLSTQVEHVQRKFVRYVLRGLDWTDMYDFPPYVDKFALICLEMLTRRRSDACVMFVFDVLSDRVGSPNLLSLVKLNP
jgi:hypothetical protein